MFFERSDTKGKERGPTPPSDGGNRLHAPCEYTLSTEIPNSCERQRQTRENIGLGDSKVALYSTPSNERETRIQGERVERETERLRETGRQRERDRKRQGERDRGGGTGIERETESHIYT